MGLMEGELERLVKVLAYAERHGLPVRVENGMVSTINLGCCHEPTRNCTVEADYTPLCEETDVDWAEATRGASVAQWECEPPRSAVLARPVTLRGER